MITVSTGWSELAKVSTDWSELSKPSTNWSPVDPRDTGLLLTEDGDFLVTENSEAIIIVIE